MLASLRSDAHPRPMNISPCHRTLALFLLLIAPMPATAQDSGVPRLVAAISGDWNGDEQLDAATITVDDHGGNVFTLYRGDAVDGLRPLVTLTDVIWSGTMAGTLPAFEPRSETAFAIYSQQTAVGRNPWHQHVTVAFRDGDYRVAGFDYSTYDRIDPGHSGDCSVNLLTGRYTLRVDPEGPTPEYGREGQTPERAFPLERLTAGFSPEICAPVFQ